MPKGASDSGGPAELGQDIDSWESREDVKIQENQPGVLAGGRERAVLLDTTHRELRSGPSALFLDLGKRYVSTGAAGHEPHCPILDSMDGPVGSTLSVRPGFVPQATRGPEASGRRSNRLGRPKAGAKDTPERSGANRGRRAKVPELRTHQPTNSGTMRLRVRLCQQNNRGAVLQGTHRPSLANVRGLALVILVWDDGGYAEYHAGRVSRTP